MIITDSSVSMSASHDYATEKIRREYARAWVGADPSADGNREVSLKSVDLEKFSASMEQQAARLQTQAGGAAVQVNLSQAAKDASAAQTVKSKGSTPSTLDDIKLEMIKKLFESMTGKKFKILSLKDLQGESSSSSSRCDANRVLDSLPGGSLTMKAANADQEQTQSMGWGLEAELYERYSESEETTFSSSGSVKTADGKQISFSLDLSMSRSFTQENYASLRMGDALKDPLVINYGGGSAELTQDKYSFDIDSDGKADQISFLAGGSGFLALDKNGDGEINDGKELFGTKSGNGFKDLATYDDDSNGWIDENDSVYDKLRIWSKDSSGADQLVAIGQRGVGAIYLGSAATPFEQKTQDDNTLLGATRASGVFLREDGSAGSVQQVDLAVA